jgi:hypothetical protein
MAPRKPRTPKRSAGTRSILPMELRPGDTFTDEAGTWEIVGHPTTQRGGKDVTVKVQRPSDPRSRREQWWPAYERVTVARPTAT